MSAQKCGNLFASILIIVIANWMWPLERCFWQHIPQNPTLHPPVNPCYRVQSTHYTCVQVEWVEQGQGMRKRKGEYKLFHKSQVLRILVEPCRFTTATPAAAGRDGIFRLSYSGESQEGGKEGDKGLQSCGALQADVPCKFMRHKMIITLSLFIILASIYLAV